MIVSTHGLLEVSSDPDSPRGSMYHHVRAYNGVSYTLWPSDYRIPCTAQNGEVTLIRTKGLLNVPFNRSEPVTIWADFCPDDRGLNGTAKYWVLSEAHVLAMRLYTHTYRIGTGKYNPEERRFVWSEQKTLDSPTPDELLAEIRSIEVSGEKAWACLIDEEKGTYEYSLGIYDERVCVFHSAGFRFLSSS